MTPKSRPMVPARLQHTNTDSPNHTADSIIPYSGSPVPYILTEPTSDCGGEVARATRAIPILRMHDSPVGFSLVGVSSVSQRRHRCSEKSRRLLAQLAKQTSDSSSEILPQVRTALSVVECKQHPLSHGVTWSRSSGPARKGAGQRS